MLRQYDGWCELNIDASGEDAFDDINVTKSIIVVKENQGGGYLAASLNSATNA